MGQINHIQQSFIAGEVSPRLQFRSDSSLYTSGLSTCLNMLPQVHGGLTRRTGSIFAAPCAVSSGNVALIPFSFSKDESQSYILEFTNGKVRFFKDNEQVRETANTITNITRANPAVVTSAAHGYSNGDEVYISGVVGMTEVNGRWFTVAGVTTNTFQLSGLNSSTYTAYSSAGTAEKVYEVTTPYTSAQVNDIRWRQSADVLFLVHGAHEPRELTRTGDTSWTLSTTSFVDGPYLDENITTTTLTPSGTSGSVTVTASATAGINGGDGFQTTDVGRVIRWHDGTNWFWMTITARSSTTVVTATIEASATLGATTATIKWRLGAWSDTTGFPRVTTFYENRAYFGNTTAQPNTIWGSAIDGYQDFTPGTDADDPVTFTLASNELNEIKWMYPRTSLEIGTQGAEWTALGSSDETISPTNPPLTRPSTRVGSKFLPAVGIGGATVYAQRTGKQVHALSYSFEQDNLVSPNLAIQSEHITGDGITRMAYAATPDSVLWSVREDGALLSFTYDRENSVSAWARHELGGTDTQVLSIGTIPTASQERVWLAVSRTINGSTDYYIEYLEDEYKSKTLNDAVYVDSAYICTGDTPAATLTPGATTGTGITFTAGSAVFSTDDVGRVIRSGSGKAIVTAYGSTTTVTCTIVENFASTSAIASGDWTRSSNTVSGLWHLEGETLTLAVDGANHPTVTVTNGTITLTGQYTNVVAGLGYTSEAKTLDISQGSSAGTAFGSLGRITDLQVRLYESVGLEVGTSDSTLYTVNFRTPNDKMNEAVPLYSGYKRVRIEDTWKDTGTYIIFRKTDALPLTLLGCVAKFEVSDAR